MNRWLGRTAAALALAGLTLSAHAGVPTLLAIPWGLIYTVINEASKPSTPEKAPVESSAATEGVNHWVLTSTGPGKSSRLQTLTQLQTAFGDAIRKQVPAAQITTGSLSIPAAEAVASAALTATGWIACDEPVFEARADAVDPTSKQIKRLHVCVTHSQAGYQTAVYAFDGARHSTRLALPFTREAPATSFMADPQGQAPALVQQLHASLSQHFATTQQSYAGSVKRKPLAPTASQPRAYGD